MSLEQVAESDRDRFDWVVANTPELCGAELEVSRLSGGLTNSNYRVAVADEEFVVRVCRQGRSAVAIDRFQESKVLEAVTASGISPEVVAYFLPQGHSVTRFLSDAASLAPDDVKSGEFLDRLAALIREVHEVEMSVGPVDRYGDIRSWMEVIGSRGTGYSERLDELLDRVEETEKSGAGLGRLVLCHNDAYYPNILVGEKLWLIDWECAGLGDPLYDLTSTGYLLTSEQRAEFLGSYLGEEPGPSVLDDFDRLVEVFLCWNAMWALIQEGESDLDFDYLQLSRDLVEEALSSPTKPFA